MKIYTHDTWITLTPDQVAEIEKTKAELEKCIKSFHDVLIHFGLKKIDTSDWEDKNCLWYEHPNRNWCAEITKHNSHWVDAWAAGECLKNTGFPGGHVYGEPAELRDAFLEALKQYAMS